MILIKVHGFRNLMNIPKSTQLQTKKRRREEEKAEEVRKFTNSTVSTSNDDVLGTEVYAMKNLDGGATAVVFLPEVPLALFHFLCKSQPGVCVRRLVIVVTKINRETWQKSTFCKLYNIKGYAVLHNWSSLPVMYSDGQLLRNTRKKPKISLKTV
jgi:hypothetical protein